ncbi:MAG TPA: sugar transferase [bacterium]|nr:sugar transferase [bacterium]HOL35279.1 sugar transferase [bacterium]HPP08794.1 sugar transferase [bacterium]
MPGRFYLSCGKSILDVFLAFAGLGFVLPVMIAVALLIKISSPGPVFFKQKRVGKNFNLFYLLKFRTMVVDAEKIGPKITKDSDPRITKIGKLLRKTKIDELPQLINVLKGEMSFVGPRPEVEKYVKIFNDDYRNILTMKPGITDYATIEFRNEENILSNYEDTEQAYIKEILPAKIGLYKKYLREAGFITDLAVILKTVFKIIDTKK